ncbi:MAG: hydrogenase nickel incorporation protein HypA/HybF/putative two-component system protein, hydrogenase maturation factor HypX/HoxX [Candidatus Kentron sp. G]|nr:MAG: hydrogenase nickel incorporation protein HypA/HybF/putative two-component system protein, hydrogenase maturation factor HypX/HoxX [Candidatus Kentron sp. G]VFM96299.1 MAG: hydrogenase nickel incorporation protein HypA/HybF/putative two-component system protein, hydrogenase maturation factor HypX/HoxX [Candidatus Kentron sp. G]VFM98458.1 MAG: hydrogenase nickel incorporation protein HypA/HybF/putative two-component system protein, hydrogenase maturation factor HypX/HoxX [Candidatus Kentron
MHEFSVCRALIRQIESIAQDHGAQAVKRIVLQIGPLSGVEIPLLEQAFPFAATDTLARKAALVIEPVPVIVRCRVCGAENQTQPNRLLCPACGDLRTELVSGDRMMLMRLEMEIE